jgi:hypothetical protein
MAAIFDDGGGAKRRCVKAHQVMTGKDPSAILDGFTNLSGVLLFMVADGHGAVDPAERRRMARKIVDELRSNPSPGPWRA